MAKKQSKLQIALEKTSNKKKTKPWSSQNKSKKKPC